MAHAEDGLNIEEGIGPQEIDAGPVSVVVVFGAVTTLILIFLTIMFFNFMENQIMETKGLDEPIEKVAAVVADQKKQLASYGMVDAKKNLASVPIDAAMAMIVEQRTKDPNPKINPALQAKPADAKDAGKTAPDQKSAPAKDSAKKKEDAPKAGAKGNEKH
jgi:signal transduction histidine kinase